MTENVLGKLFEHNNWANIHLIQACSALNDEKLDTEPKSATKGSTRLTLMVGPLERLLIRSPEYQRE
jgi:uncharacterized damage-inducible protein DinB